MITKGILGMTTVMGTWFAFIVFPCVASVQHWCVPGSVALDFPRVCVLSVTSR